MERLSSRANGSESDAWSIFLTLFWPFSHALGSFSQSLWALSHTLFGLSPQRKAMRLFRERAKIDKYKRKFLYLKNESGAGLYKVNQTNPPSNHIHFETNKFPRKQPRIGIPSHWTVKRGYSVCGCPQRPECKEIWLGRRGIFKSPQRAPVSRHSFRKSPRYKGR